MANRKGLTKKQRFEIFKRDSFTCQYCGRRPPEIVLEVDHINPVAEGGDNDGLNLITSCHDCNSGKGKTQLADKGPMPDANEESLALQQEIAEMALYSRLKIERDSWTEKIIAQLQDHWSAVVGGEFVPGDNVIRLWLGWASPRLIEKAITITAQKDKFDRATSQGIKYASGVMHNLIDAGEA